MIPRTARCRGPIRPLFAKTVESATSKRTGCSCIASRAVSFASFEQVPIQICSDDALFGRHFDQFDLARFPGERFGG
jgi:hypothetical protein